MLPNRVDAMLKNYRVYLGRCKFLEHQIAEHRMMIESLKATMVADASEPGSQNMDGMPHGTQVGRPTERIAVMFADGYEPDEIRELKKELDDLEAEYKEKSPTVMFVEAWLLGLSESERWLIENQVIDGVTWKEVVTRYERRFGDYRTKDGLKKIKARALEKIYGMAE